ncbi:MAG TPA: cation transporter [Rhabdaerophilum sp.]|nr:cation transporter [Rhabdaerophilum sp.]
MEKAIEIQVEGMGCQKCVTSVEAALKRVDPAACVEVDLAGKRVRVADATAPLAVLEGAIEDAGYDVVK